MKTFFKFLLLLILAANLLLLFVFDRLIPASLHFPFGSEELETIITEEEEKEDEAGTVDIEEAAVHAEEPAEQPEPEPETEPVPGTDTVMVEETEEEALPVCRIISQGGSNIRSGPGIDFEIIASYFYDTRLSLTGEPENGWYPILAEDGTEGYIFETQIEIPDETADATGEQTEGWTQ